MNFSVFSETLMSRMQPAARELSGSDIAAITFTGLAVVFLGLIILVLFLTVMGKIMNTSKPAAPAKPAPAPAAKQEPAPAPVQAVDDDAEVVAAITAAITAMGEAEGKTYAVKSVKPKQGGNAGTRPAWHMAGIRDNTTPF